MQDLFLRFGFATFRLPVCEIPKVIKKNMNKHNIFVRNKPVRYICAQCVSTSHARPGHYVA